MIYIYKHYPEFIYARRKINSNCKYLALLPEYVIPAGLLWWIISVHRRGLLTAKYQQVFKKSEI